ncbi:MAG: hypothetical protein R3C15_11440 [Thermoleophilia bacterium]
MRRELVALPWTALRRPLLLAAAAGATSVALAACGGGGASREEFLAKADAICAQADAEIAAVRQPTTVEGAVEAIDRLREISERQLADLRALEPPAAEREKLDELFALADEQLALAIDYRDAIAQQDRDLIRELADRANRLRAEAQEGARAYGFRVCGTSDPATAAG